MRTYDASDDRTCAFAQGRALRAQQRPNAGCGGKDMTVATGVRRRGGAVGRRLSRFWSGITAVSIKELRGRMRGRRAFVVLTIYLLLLSLFAFAIYYYLRQQAVTTLATNPNILPGIPRDFPGMPMPGGFTQTLSNGTALSAAIGHGIFGGLLALETLLVLVLAPAFTTGAISLEREKQTIDMLVTTPLSTLGMVMGKLFSALSYVFLLIIASLPLASLVFVFGGVGPEDLIRAYGFLFALAFGMGAIGLFVSALVKRTQTATVVTFVIVLVLSIGTAALHQFWQMAARSTNTSVLVSSRARAPEAMLWLNPFVADADMICATAPDSYHASCEYISNVTNRPYFGTPTQAIPGVIIDDGPAIDLPVPQDAPGAAEFGIGSDDAGGLKAAPDCPPNARCVDPSPTTEQISFGFPRDTFWPKSAIAFVLLGIVLTLASAQLVSPTRRLRLGRPRRMSAAAAASTTGNQTAVVASDTPPTSAVAVDEVSDATVEIS
jgi:ABC-type transport system involved in multi-copper enzyme maturation permease subunit